MGLQRQEKFLEVLGSGLELPGWDEASVGCQRTGGESLSPGCCWLSSMRVES